LSEATLAKPLPRRRVSNLNLYAAAVLIWGSTWLAIKFQLGTVPPAVSVVWRFALSSAVLLIFASCKRMKLTFSAREHFWIALVGLSMFGINYVGVYLSEQYLASGLVAVIFSLMAFFNIILMRIFYATPIKPAGLLGAMLGIAGVVLVFWPEVAKFSASGNGLRGLIYAFLATAIASFGNIAATRTHRAGIETIPMSAWAMLYGAIFVAIYAALTGERFIFDSSFSYVSSLLYLALFGSVIAFSAYLTLMARIGAHRVGFSSVAIPIVALLLSTLFEHLQWQATMAAGIVLCLVGNILVLARDRR
jgi:drug/metabolite transporter (DMT)-like permease